MQAGEEVFQALPLNSLTTRPLDSADMGYGIAPVFPQCLIQAAHVRILIERHKPILVLKRQSLTKCRGILPAESDAGRSYVVMEVGHVNPYRSSWPISTKAECALDHSMRFSPRASAHPGLGGAAASWQREI